MDEHLKQSNNCKYAIQQIKRIQNKSNKKQNVITEFN